MHLFGIPQIDDGRSGSILAAGYVTVYECLRFRSLVVFVYYSSTYSNRGQEVKSARMVVQGCHPSITSKSGNPEAQAHNKTSNLDANIRDHQTLNPSPEIKTPIQRTSNLNPKPNLENLVNLVGASRASACRLALSATLASPGRPPGGPGGLVSSLGVGFSNSGF